MFFFKFFLYPRIRRYPRCWTHVTLEGKYWTQIPEREREKERGKERERERERGGKREDKLVKKVRARQLRIIIRKKYHKTTKKNKEKEYEVGGYLRIWL